MSGTGRIGTKYENLAVDSDCYRRATANDIACIYKVHSIYIDHVQYILSTMYTFSAH